VTRFPLAFLYYFVYYTLTMEFAVIATGGKQYKVKTGDTIKIEKIKGALKVGDKVTFDQVLLVEGKETAIGTPFLAGNKVEGTLKEIGRNKTIDVIKYKQKSRYFKKNGHRQPWFKVEISNIK
jgi:large subunit ribosomal protein L21